MVLVNCLLNAFTICLCVVAVLLLKEIDSVVVCLGRFLFSSSAQCVRALFVIPYFV